MARRSERKTRHHRPYEEWKRPTPFDQLVDLVRQADRRYSVEAYERDIFYDGNDGKRSTSATEKK